MREWLFQRVEGLACRLAYTGVGPDLAALSVAELWGLYCFLQRLSDG